MRDRQAVTVQLQERIRLGSRLPFQLRREIKRVVEEMRHERRTRDRLNADAGRMNIQSDAQLATIEWIGMLRLHVMDWTGPARCKRRRFSGCYACTLLSYLCMAFMDPSKPSQYARFQRRVLSWAAVAVLWVIILLSVSGLLSTTTYLSDLGDTAVVGVFVAVFGALYLGQIQFVKETVEQMPYDSPPFLPLWFDDMKRIRLRRRRALLSTADSVLELHDRRAAPPTDAAAR